MSANWYWMDQGTRQGPITAKELKALALAGRIHPDTQVQKDGMAGWVSASQVKGLFDSTALKKCPPSDQPSSLGDTDSAAFESTSALPPPIPGTAQRDAPPLQWHYTIDGHKAGPVSVVELNQLAEDGFITSETLVWRPGLPDWIAISEAQLGFGATTRSAPIKDPHVHSTSLDQDHIPSDEAKARKLIRVCSGLLAVLAAFGVLISMVMPYVPPSEFGFDPAATKDEVSGAAFKIFIRSVGIGVVAVALWKLKKWAWVLSVIIGVCNLLNGVFAPSYDDVLVGLIVLILLAKGRSACQIGDANPSGNTL